MRKARLQPFAIRWIGALLVGTVAALASGGCTPEPNFNDVRGRVIDQDTGQGIAGAIVVAQYTGINGPHGFTACNRIESTTTDADGRYELPIDTSTQLPLLSAYAPGYARGQRLRGATQMDPEHPERWQVAHFTWNAQNDRGSLVSVEPQIYSSQRAAQMASGELRDVYLRRSGVDKTERLHELRVMGVPGNCGGGATKSEGGVPFLQAIMKEQLSLGAPEADIQLSRESIRMAQEENSKRKRETKR